MTKDNNNQSVPIVVWVPGTKKTKKVLIGIWDTPHLSQEHWDIVFRYKDGTYKLSVPVGTVISLNEVPLWVKFAGLSESAFLAYMYLYMQKGNTPLGTFYEYKHGEWVTLYSYWPRKIVDRIFIVPNPADSRVQRIKKHLALLIGKCVFWKNW